MLFPLDETSAAFTAMGMVVRYILIRQPKFSRSASTVLLARLVLPSTSVSRIPSIVRFRLVCFFTLAIVDKSCVIPFAGRYCTCTGIITLSAAVRALSVIIPRDGIQPNLVSKRRSTPSKPQNRPAKSV